MEFVCPPYFPTLSDADLFERLTAIVETTTAHLNAIRDAGIGGLGEVPGRRPVFVCQENQDQYRRRESRFWVSDPEPGPRAVLPDAGKMALAHLHAKIAMSVLDPEASRRVSDIEWEKGGLSCWQRSWSYMAWLYLCALLILFKY